MYGGVCVFLVLLRVVQIFESYSYNTATVQVDWMQQAITLATDDFTAADFSMSNITHYKHTEVRSVLGTPPPPPPLKLKHILQSDF